MTKVDRPEPTPDEGAPDQRPGRTRRRVLLIAGAVVVAAALVVAISVAAVRGAQNAEAKATSTPAAFQLPTPDPNSPAPPSASPSPTASSGGSTEAAPKKADPRYGAPVASVVSRDSTATLAGGLSAKLQVENTRATAVRAGETAGPAIKVELELTNPGSADVSLSQLAVNSYYGSDSVPATELTDGAQPLLGTLKAGETRKGVYLFSVPSDQSGKAVVTVTDAAGTPITVFK